MPRVRPPEPIFRKPSETMTIEEIFHKFLPDSLYMDHYTMSQTYGYTPQEWRTFLRDNATFIETELAAIAEAEARSALSRLGNATGQEVTALKAILEKSKLINDAQRQNTKVIMTFIPPTKLKEETQPNDSHHTASHQTGMQPASRPVNQEKSRLW